MSFNLFKAIEAATAQQTVGIPVSIRKAAPRDKLAEDAPCGKLADNQDEACPRNITAGAAPYTVDDGFGNSWACDRGYPEAKCGLQIVRPGKVQCDICDEADEPDNHQLTQDQRLDDPRHTPYNYSNRYRP